MSVNRESTSNFDGAKRHTPLLKRHVDSDHWSLAGIDIREHSGFSICRNSVSSLTLKGLENVSERKDEGLGSNFCLLNIVSAPAQSVSTA
jgi:hypothetical protein